jgi:hypothetical protein
MRAQTSCGVLKMPIRTSLADSTEQPLVLLSVAIDLVCNLTDVVTFTEYQYCQTLTLRGPGLCLIRRRPTLLTPPSSMEMRGIQGLPLFSRGANLLQGVSDISQRE